MKNKVTPLKVWSEYNMGTSFKEKINLYETVKQNENFFLGNQWEGVTAPDLDKPVFPLTKRVVSYLIATLVSNELAVSLSVPGNSDPEAETDMQLVHGEIERVLEVNNIQSMNRDFVRDAAVDGDCCVHAYFDTSIKTNNYVGEIQLEQIDNTKVIFGNPNIGEKEKQPYIILESRRLLDSVREEAKENGVSGEELDLIQPDTDEYDTNNETLVGEANKLTVLTRYWKEDGQVYFCKTTKNVMLKKPTATGLRLYPVAYMSWERIKNCYHGQAVLTGMIPNQIFINKLFAMAMKYQIEMAFPKIVYDQTRIPKWNNKIGAIGVQGDVNTAITRNLMPAEMSNQVMLLIEKTIMYTRDFLGASDAALGNVNPENTSAIIATQRATAAPLMLQKIGYKTFVEEYIRVLIDMMQAYYGVRTTFAHDDQTETNYTVTGFDFGKIREYDLQIRVDVGEGSYWDEYAQVQTLDNLFSRGLIPDAVTYLKSLPVRLVPNRSKIIQDLETAKQQAALASQQMGGLALPGDDPAQASGQAGAAPPMPEPLPETMPLEMGVEGVTF